MRFLKRSGIAVLAVAAMSIPSAAGALSINGSRFHPLLGWSHQLTQTHNFRLRQTHTTHVTRGTDESCVEKPPTHEQSVPEPTAALLFGLGAAVVATRTRKRS
jgi:PEP-CTERM motif